MEPKKNPKADMSRNSVLFFQIGMIVILLITWRAIEWKTYDKKDVAMEMVAMDDFEEEDVPITEMQNTPPPPPPPPPAPEIIEVVEDEEVVEETVIESTETSQEQEIVEVQEVQEVQEQEVIADVPFAVIEDVPIFPGCEGLNSNEERKKCMSDKIQQVVKREFRTQLGSELGLSGINRVYVQFRIEKDGTVSVLGARAPHPRLSEEAERVVKTLPRMKPGRQRGQPVGVLYSLPITFRVQD